MKPFITHPSCPFSMHTYMHTLPGSIAIFMCVTPVYSHNSPLVYRRRRILTISPMMTPPMGMSTEWGEWNYYKMILNFDQELGILQLHSTLCCSNSNMQSILFSLLCCNVHCQFQCMSYVSQYTCITIVCSPPTLVSHTYTRHFTLVSVVTGGPFTDRKL